MLDSFRFHGAGSTARLLLSLATVLTLAACGGGSSSSDNSPPVVTPTTPGTNQGRGGAKVLVIEVDGLDYDALQTALGRGNASAFATQTIARAWTGGYAGTASEQPTTPGPGWASLLTGTWASSHGVKWDTDDQRIDPAQAPTVFSLAKAHAASLKTGAVTGKAIYARLLAPDVASSALDTAVDCAGADECVTERTAQMIEQGYDLVFAQYGAPAAAALEGTVRGTAYAKALTGTAAGLEKLLARIAQRKANDPDEKWLVLVSSAYGLDAFGAPTGLQAAQNKSIVIAASPALAALPAGGESTGMVYNLPALTDIAPTLLRHLGATPANADYAFNGMALQNATVLRNLRATGQQDPNVRGGGGAASIELTWTLSGPQDSPIVVLRDGLAVASLAANATSYKDPILTGESGTLNYRYTVVAGETAVAIKATLTYQKPAVLTSAILTDLAYYYPMDSGITDVVGTSILAPWQATANGGTLITEDTFVGSNSGKALRVNSNPRGAGNQGGYKLSTPQDFAGNAAVRAFTIGFWVRVDSTCAPATSDPAYANGGVLIANKDYATGTTKGLAIGLYQGCEMRFNTGDGTNRAESAGFRMTPDQWAYVAMVIDKDALRMNSYLFDPVLGLQTGTVALTATIVSNLGGLFSGLSLNEDGLATYGFRYKPKSRDRIDYNDFAIWRRSLTAEEIRTLYIAARPLTSVMP